LELHLKRQYFYVCVIVILSGILLSCQQASTDKHFPDPKARFANFSKTCDGIPGNLPDHYGYYLTDDQKKGACTWYLWTGGNPLETNGSPENARGNPRFWRIAEKKLWEEAKILQLPINVNMLKYITGTPRGERFKTLGVINDPGCKKAAKPDAYGLWLDECEDPYSSGIMGLRLFPNPEFNASVWNADKFIGHDSRIEPPYLAGLSCGICHIAFNPSKPPADPENPAWENLAPAFGNQYINEGKMFMGGLRDDNFLYWQYHTQQAGTSDTSRISTDFINNPNAINSIWYILSARPKHLEKMNDGTMQAVPHILKDGSDSIGAAGAALRVYVNIGTCPDYRYSLEDSFVGIKTHQHPFDIAKVEKDCPDWQLTAARMGNAANFLDAVQPYRLQDAPGGKDYLKAPQDQMDLGMTVFGENCARCHSSKLPPEVEAKKLDKHSDAAKPYWVTLVKSADFLKKNFLSDDDRYPVVSRDKRMELGTNLARAVGTNPIEGHLWQNFSSATFKQLPLPGTAILENPFDKTQPIAFKIPNGGYYRTPSLINVWATAPFLHNNMLGLFNSDPSVTGRMTAFNDAAEKLLWPEKRKGKDSIKVTDKETFLKVRLISIRIPPGTPVNLLANINLYKLIQVPALLDKLAKIFEQPERLVRLVKALKNEGEFDDDLKKMVPDLLALNQAPDFIEDHGHTFGADLKDDQKKALIEYLKTF
jgi:hypothetical protein